jgi:hypothetical protein
MDEPITQAGEHVRATVRYFPGALAPAQVTPYCTRCNVAWPCPPAAMEGAPEEPEQP